MRKKSKYGWIDKDEPKLLLLLIAGVVWTYGFGQELESFRQETTRPSPASVSSKPKTTTVSLGR